MQQYKMFIDGKWVDALSGETFKDFDPFSGEVYAEVPKGDIQDADRAMSAAYAARKVWAGTPPIERSRVLRKAAQILEEKQMAYVDVLIREGGSTFGKAMFEISQTINLLQYASEDAKRILGETYHNDPTKISMSVRKPRGTVVAISPWNFPIILSMYKIAYSLAAGNTVVFKPASETPVSGLILGKLFEEAGLSSGALNIITGPGSVLGDALVEDSRCSFVAITGETGTGRHVAQKAAGKLKPYTLELGGKNPLIILADTDIDYAVKTAVFSAFLHQGEICMSTDRIIVEESIVREFTEKLVEFVSHLPVGDPKDPGTFIGPIISDKQIQSIDAHVKDAVAKGATLLIGGSYQNRLYQPTLLTNITKDMRIYSEETFGPVASIYPVADEYEALALANDTTYGLSSAVLTNDIEKAFFLAEGLEAGMVHVNEGSVDANEACPFGGVKGSGIGREGGRYSLEELTEVKWITIERKKIQYPF